MWQSLRMTLITIMTGSIASGIVLLLIPEGKGSPRRAIKALATLSMTLLLVQTLRGLPALIPETDTDNRQDAAHANTLPKETIDAIAEGTATRLETAMEAQIFDKFGKKAKLTVLLNTEKQDAIRIESISLSMAETGDAAAIADYLSMLIDCPVTVTESEQSSRALPGQ